ncbi:hypothetical protein ACFV1L_29640 [Kitasatospora sp. NPDC059646]|uniref:hypothetical protein n=1 Tax=Kitasatospora sp. NPDC059646 TaxID=3346893 RepID=UPI00369CE03D
MHEPVLPDPLTADLDEAGDGAAAVAEKIEAVAAWYSEQIRSEGSRRSARALSSTREKTDGSSASRGARGGVQGAVLVLNRSGKGWPS